MKKYLLTGLVILLPLALTAMIISFLFDLFTAPLIDLVQWLVSFTEQRLLLTLPSGFTPVLSRLLAFFFLCLFLILLGIFARWFLVKNFLRAVNRLFSRIPFVKTLYKVSRDLINALFSADGKKAFKRPVLVPFPERSSFCLAFEAGEVAEECQNKVSEPLASVFIPTAPHPISGFFFLIPKKDVHPLEMTNEEAVKFLVSCGMIHPLTPPSSQNLSR